MMTRAKLAVALAGIILSSTAIAGQYYLFPVKEIEGLAAKAAGVEKSLVDSRAINKIFGDRAGQEAQRSVVEHFVAALNGAYPSSVVHPRQVYDVNVGTGHRFVNDDLLACKQAPSFNVADTYAVVIGITRASIYEVVKGNNIEVLVPITLNLQFIKPNLAKTVYTLSETVYSPFRLSKAEYESGAADQTIRDILVRNIKAQVDTLVASAKRSFDPKDIVVKLVARDGKFLVTDKGVEVGFVKGEQVEARDSANKTAIFDVLYADSGYAVLKTAAGSASVGDSLRFVFDKTVDDSRKPRLMPVVSRRTEDSWSSAVSEIFSKDIGFNASFQLSPVDVNFALTKELITRSANCVTWQKIPSMTEVSGERKDAPNFFIRFTPTVSPTATLIGKGGTKTSEMFHTLVSAQVADQFGRVIFSEMGDNEYMIERVNGEGLSFAQAKEISLKNSTQKLARNVIANVRFEPKEYRIAKADQDRLWVEGLQGISPTEKLTLDVLHPLSVQVHGKPAMLDLDASAGNGDIAMDGNLAGLPYSAANPVLPKPQRGDVVRLYSRITPGITALQDCSGATYIGQNNLVEVDYLAPLIRHAVYKSSRFASHIGDEQFYADVNGLLQQGMFDLQLKKPAIELCSQPGYAIREEKMVCDDDETCKATVTMGVVARLKKGEDILKTVTSGLRSEFSGFSPAGRQAYYGYKQLSNGLSMQPDLIKKLNSN